MLNINNKKRLIVSAFVAVAVILPAAIFAIGNLAKSNDSFADTAAMNASGFYDEGLWKCVVRSYYGSKEAAEGKYDTQLTDSQLGEIKKFECGSYIVQDWRGLNKLSGVTLASMWNQTFTSFKPSDYFQNVQELILNENSSLASIDLSGASTLKKLRANKTNLSSVTGLNSSNLEVFTANEANFSTIDVSGMSSLQELGLADNHLTSVRLPNSCNLVSLNVRDNSGLTSFTGNLNSCTNLVSVAIINDNFSNINVSGISGLKALKAKGNPLSVVDISNNKQLTNIQLDPEDYVVPDVAPTAGNNGNLIYDFNAFSFVRTTDSHWTGYQSVFDGGNNNYAPSTTDKKVTVYNYNNLPTVTGASSAYNNTYKYLRVTQQTSGVADTLEDNANWYDIVNNTYRVIIEPADTEEYTLTFNSQGGSSVESKSCDAMAGGSCPVQVPANPTRTGYTFKGWADTASGTPRYQAGSNVTLDSNKTVYAIWEEDEPESVTYKLTFNSQGGSSVMAKTCTTNTGSCPVQVPANPTRTGYTFKGWADTTSGTPRYQAGSNITLDSNKTVYAIWEEDAPAQQKFTITYNANGGSGAPTQGSCEGATSCTAPISTGKPMRTGYTFLGWSTNQNATTPDTNYAGGKTVTLSSNITLYAVWKQNPAEETPFKISYSANGGTNAPDDSECTGVGSCTTQVSPDLPERDGYTFLGWSTDPSATEPNTDYAPGKAVEISDNIILYAVWQANTPDDNGNFTLTFDPQGGTAVSPKSCDKPGTCVVTIPDAPTRDNYSFEGWATTPDGEPEYQPNDAITLDGNKTLYAIWKNVDNGGTDGEHGIGTPNTGEATDGGEGASAVYIIAGVLLAMAAPTYFGIRNYKKSKFIKR